METRVKICGITNLEDAEAAIGFGADALGFVFFKGSPRYITPHNAAAIIRKLPALTLTVGVFVNEDPAETERISRETGLDIIQLHGNESPGMCRSTRRVIKAIRVTSLESLDPLVHYQGLVSAFLLDTYSPGAFGGTGQIFNWDIAVEAKQFGRIILAGGLTPDNIGDAVRMVKLYGVDVSSGVEREKGKKDYEKLKLFIRRAKS